MREVERPEVMVMHCDWCGCKNKLKTDYGMKGQEPVGFTLRCCNCGHMDMFNRNYSRPMDLYNLRYEVLNMRCIMEQACVHKDCPLYKTRPVHNKKPPIKKPMKKCKRKIPEGVVLDPLKFI